MKVINDHRSELQYLSNSYTLCQIVVFLSCVSCGTILPLVQFLFSFLLDSLSYITIHHNNGKHQAKLSHDIVFLHR